MNEFKMIFSTYCIDVVRVERYHKKIEAQRIFVSMYREDEGLCYKKDSEYFLIPEKYYCINSYKSGKGVHVYLFNEKGEPIYISDVFDVDPRDRLYMKSEANRLKKYIADDAVYALPKGDVLEVAKCGGKIYNKTVSIPFSDDKEYSTSYLSMFR